MQISTGFAAVSLLLSMSGFAAETFTAPPRPAGVRLRCPLIFSQLRTAPTFWRDGANFGLVRQIAADPRNTFFRQELGQRLENEFSDDLTGKDAVRTKARGRFLSQSTALEILLEKYGVENIGQLPAHAQGEARSIHNELAELFGKYGASWTPRVKPAKAFEFKNGVVSGVAIDLKDFFERSDGLTGAQALNAFVKNLPETIQSWEIVGGTPEQLATFLQWNAKKRFTSVRISNALGPLEPILVAIEPHADGLQKLEFTGYNFNQQQLAWFEPYAGKVPGHSVAVPVESPAFHGLFENLFDGAIANPEIRRVAWHNVLRQNVFSPAQPGLRQRVVEDMPFLIREPDFWRLLTQSPVASALALYEELPTKPATLRKEFLRKTLLFYPTKAIAEFAEATMTGETKTRRKVSPAGAMLSDFFASEVLSEPRFAVLRGLRAIHELQGPKETFARARERWLADEKSKVNEKIEYVAQEIGNPAVRAIFEGAPQTPHWNQIREAVGRDTLHFAWKALQSEGKKAGDPLFDALAKDKSWWVFNAAVPPGPELSSNLLPEQLYAMPEQLNAWAAKANHPFRYEAVQVSEGLLKVRRLARRPVTNE